MKLGVLVSGTGTNLQALIDAPLAPAEIAVVISNVAGAPAVARARAAGLAVAEIPSQGKSREAFEAELVAALDAAGVDALVLAGFMRVLTAEFVARYPLRILNTHPSLLPAFPGKDAIGQALAHGVKLTGVTIHFVDASLDGGPIIAQEAVEVLPDDTADALRARLQAVEHRLLPAVVRRLAAGQLSCQGRIVRAE